MIGYMLRRILQAIPTVIGVTIISFAIMRMAPGDPVQLLTFNPGAKASDRALLEKQLCLDRNIVEQYAIWIVGDFRGVCNIQGLVRGDFGTSFYDRRPVLDMLLEKIPATIELSIWALVIGVSVGVSIGVLSAVLRGTWVDNLSRFFSVVFDAIPAFWFGLLLIMYFAVRQGWLPVGGRIPINVDDITIVDRIRHLLMPSFVLAVGWIALMSRYMRGETLEVIRKEYVRTAHAKGLHPGRVNYVHAARNALIPIVTFLGPAIVGLISGAVIIERIFSWPGIGRTILDAINQRDYPVVMGSVLISAFIVIAGNLLTDFLLVLVDPRIRLS